ncbi:MAG: MurT ligase domain-containing protein [Gaiellales bacterium]
MGMRLTLEVPLARAVGRLSRLAGRGGGTTLPGKLLWTLDRRGVGELAQRLRDGAIAVSATNGKTTTSTMIAEILSPSTRFAWNNAGANLASGVTSALLEARDAQLGLFEVDEFALPAVLETFAPRVVALGNLFRDQLDRYGELEHIAERWRAAIAALPASTRLVLNADDPLVASLGEGREGVCFYGVDDPTAGRASLPHAADSKHCVRCGAPYSYTVSYVGHLGDYRCPACGHRRPPLDVAARAIAFSGLDSVAFSLESADGARPLHLPLPGLYNVYNALAAASVARSLEIAQATVTRALAGVRPAFGRMERIELDGRRLLLLLVKNPAGANEAVRTLEHGGVPATLLVALNDAIADGRDVSWIWDVDFEPLLAASERVVVTGGRAAELALRFLYGGLPEAKLEVVDDLECALDRGLEVTAPGGELAVLPTYTAMLALRGILTTRGAVRPFWERSAGS